MKTTCHAAASWRRWIAFALTLAACMLPVFAQSQAEMNAEADADFQKADATLNVVYKKLRASLDEEGQAKLKTAQKAWLVYRDAEAALEADANRGGSIAPMVYAMSRTSATQARTKTLEAILSGPDEESATRSGADISRGVDDPGQ